MLIMGCFLNLCVHTAAPEPDFGAYASAIAREKGVVARWPFTEGAEANADLRALGTPAWGAGGVSLPAGSWLVLDDTAALDTLGTTWEIVFRLDAAPGFAHNPCLVAMRTQHATRLSVHIAGDYSGVVLWNGAHPSFTHLVDGPLEQGHWYHLAVADNGEDGVVLSLNGVPRDLAPPSGISHATKGLPLTVGAANPDGHEHLPCTVAHLAIYDRALSGEEVARHADALGFAAYRAETGPVQLAQDKARRAEEEARRAERAKTIAARKAAMLADPALTARGESRVLRGEYLEAISLPVGGIGAGLIQMNGKAEPAIWQIFNNFAEVRVPDSFLAVRARLGNDDPVTRALQTAPAGPFAPMAGLSFEGRYPFGWYRFEDDNLPVKAELEVFNPFIPMNARDSGIPCAVFNVTVSNPGDTPAEVSVLASQQNAVGCTGREAAKGRMHGEYGGNVNTVVRKDAYTALHMTGHAGNPAGETPCCADPSACDTAPGADGHGNMTLALFGAASARASWTDADALAREFADTGLADADAASAPSPAGETVNGALASSFTLEPGASRTVTVVLTWFFPGEPEGAWRGKGTMYTNWYASSLEVADDLAARLDTLTAQTRKYVDTFYAGNLPVWLLDRISSQAAILRTRTCYWTQDGYFGGHEGTCPTIGCCPGNCNHVWHYAQAHARLFPEIGRRMREQAFAHQYEDGGLQHRQMGAHPVCDGQMGDILGAYREHLLSPDAAWLDAQWPAVQNAMEYVINRWDADEDGLFTGPQFNTLDSELGGATTWMGSLYCAALDACARMALLQGDTALADRYDTIRRDAAKNQNDLLWNGQYYIQVPDENPLHDYRTGCAIDQLLGEWWARQLGLDWIYPEDRAASALRALIEHNFQPDFHGVPQIPRKFVSDADAGMQMIAWPEGERRPLPHILYADEVMTGFEYSAAGAMIQHGLLREGLMVAKAIADRYDGRRRTDVTDAVHASWGYTGNPFGDDECGKFYARAMSVWSLLTACQGFHYDGPAGVLSFDPVWQPEDHASFFTVAEGWGLYTQRAGMATLDLRHGRLFLNTFSVTGAPGLDADNVRVAVRAGETPRWEASAEDGRLTVAFPDGLTLTEGQVLEITVR
jgi:non-lysosomal glucosylceramidase